MRELAFGEYRGDVLERHEEEGFLLTRTAHEPRLSVERHQHVSPYYCLVLSGGFVETSARGRHECGAGALVYHAHPDPHEDVLLPEGSLCLNIQLPAIACGTDKSLVTFGGPLTWLAARLLEAPCPETVRKLASETTRYLALRKAPEPVRRANALISNFTDWTVSAIAEQVGTHPSYLTRLYRETYGHSLKEHLTRARLRRATMLLAGRESTIAEIAMAAGFFDQSHFTTAFRERSGFTPAEFRRLFVSALG